MAVLGHMESSLARIDTLAGDAGALMTEVNALVDETNGMVADAEELIGNANRVVVDNTEAVTEAVAKLNSVDFARLNEAINGLADTVRPFANFVNLFRQQ